MAIKEDRTTKANLDRVDTIKMDRVASLSEIPERVKNGHFVFVKNKYLYLGVHGQWVCVGERMEEN